MSDTVVMKGVSRPAEAFPAVLPAAQSHDASGRDLPVATAII
jgi:hypothetical protein